MTLGSTPRRLKVYGFLPNRPHPVLCSPSAYKSNNFMSFLKDVNENEFILFHFKWQRYLQKTTLSSCLPINSSLKWICMYKTEIDQMSSIIENKLYHWWKWRCSICVRGPVLCGDKICLRYTMEKIWLLLLYRTWPRMTQIDWEEENYVDASPLYLNRTE